ncbi:MAG: metallophosphoesterase family protein [Calditrichia bacterium]|nr:metallophosphoesterase family protein [Calditrichota bacterium]MCB0270255.1 metallophosphoesterase family protein [Calditrichota bacterium]MCB0285507.1 metallophosphoesterase family protein [Calditrichota bacterium]MCB9067138.1 metallophosphoesterase family protein [Calditrichia bacterium]
MKIAIISDIHDHRKKLENALSQIQDADKLICCGDLCSPFIVKDLASGFSKPIHIVFGNNDGDLFRITQVANDFDHVHLHGEVADLLIDNKRFAVSHFDNIGRMLATSDAFDVVCFGHNHKYEVSYDGDTLRINPGEIMGELTGHSSFVVYDTESGEVIKYEVQK